jgi:hypothetical protein
MAKGQYTLQGVIAVGDLRIALLREKTSGKVIRVERGKDVNGATLSVVDPDKVTLAQGGDEEVLTLQVAKAAAAPAGANAAAPAPTQPSGMFATTPQPGVGPNAPGGPVPAAVGAGPGAPIAPPVAPQPGTAPPGAPGAANPAQRSGFGPFQGTPSTPSSTTPDAATPMTPEELLARRRARRGQQQPNQ